MAKPDADVSQRPRTRNPLPHFQSHACSNNWGQLFPRSHFYVDGCPKHEQLRAESSCLKSVWAHSLRSISSDLPALPWGGGGHNDPHFTDEDAEACRDYLLCLCLSLPLSLPLSHCLSLCLPPPPPSSLFHTEFLEFRNGSPRPLWSR